MSPVSYIYSLHRAAASLNRSPFAAEPIIYYWYYGVLPVFIYAKRGYTT